MENELNNPILFSETGSKLIFKPYPNGLEGCEWKAPNSTVMYQIKNRLSMRNDVRNDPKDFYYPNPLGITLQESL